MDTLLHNILENFVDNVARFSSRPDTILTLFRVKTGCRNCRDEDSTHTEEL